MYDIWLCFCCELCVFCMGDHIVWLVFDIRNTKYLTMPKKHGGSMSHGVGQGKAL